MRPFASNEMVIKARQMHLQGMGVSEIARSLGFNEKNIYGLTARRQIYRWLAPLPDSSASYLIKTLAEQGKSKREARKIVGFGKTRFKRLIDRNLQISWNLKTEKPFHEKIEDQLIELADRGLSMRQASIVLGVNREKVRLIAARMPNNPWGPREIASAWLHKTGETVAQTARRLADTHTLIQVATLIGYGDGRALRKALIARNVHVKFVVDPRNEARWHRKSA